MRITQHPFPEYQPMLGKLIAALMVRHNYSIRGLAADAGVSATQISNIRKGDTNPTIDSLRRLTICLNTTPSQVLRSVENVQCSPHEVLDSQQPMDSAPDAGTSSPVVEDPAEAYAEEALSLISDLEF